MVTYCVAVLSLHRVYQLCGVCVCSLEGAGLNQVVEKNLITVALCSGSNEEMRKEAHILATLEHPNIVRYYGAWEEKFPREWLDIATLSSNEDSTL